MPEFLKQAEIRSARRLETRTFSGTRYAGRAATFARTPVLFLVEYSCLYDMQYCQVSRFSVRRINRLFRDSPETSRIFHPLRENDPGTKFSGKKEFDDEDVGSAEKTIHPGGKENSFQRQSNVLVPKSMPGIAQNSARNGEEKKSGFRFEAIRSAGTKAVTVAAAILSGKRDFLWHFLVLFTVRQIPSWSFFPILYNYAGKRCGVPQKSRNRLLCFRRQKIFYAHGWVVLRNKNRKKNSK